ncbi:MAG: hypothetical protein WCS20_05085 [Alphaproteobacteria bacterium]|jgi:hypothetical protein
MASFSSEPRAFLRYDTDVPAMVTSATMRISVKMLSVSASGAMVRMDRLSAKVFDDDVFMLEVSGIGRFAAYKKWRRDTDLGCKFDVSDQDRLYLAERLAVRFGRAKVPTMPVAALAPRP